MANRNTKYKARRWHKAARQAMRTRDAEIDNGEATTPLSFIKAYNDARNADK